MNGESQNYDINKFNNLYDKAYRLQEGNIWLHENYGKKISFIKKLKLKKCINLLKRCIQIYPLSCQSAWLLGKAYQTLEQDMQALEWFEKSYEIHQSNPNVPREATLQCLKLGLGEKAEKYAQIAVIIDNNNSGLYANYALALLINKKQEEALKAIKKALELDAKDIANKNVYNLIMDVCLGKKPRPNKIGPCG